MTHSAASALVVGIGSADGGDDAIGPLVVGRVQEVTRDSPMRARVRVVPRADPAALLTLLDPGSSTPGASGASTPLGLLVVVDAVRAPAAEPGRVVVLRTGPDRAPLPAVVDQGTAGTHGFGLAAALELARALGRLPAEVVVVGVALESARTGAALSPAVARAVDRATGTVLALVGAQP